MPRLLGPLRLSRAYYYCRPCGHGRFPFDEEAGLGVHRVTPGAQRLAGLLGLTCDGFAEAALKVLPEACGLRLSESTVGRLTEDTGARLGRLHEAGQAPSTGKPFDGHEGAHGRTCASVSVDLTGVPQQARGGGPAEGRMPYVAAVYSPVPEKPDRDKDKAEPEPVPVPGYEPVAETAAPADALPGSEPPGAPGRKRPRLQARYVAGRYGLLERGLRLRQQAADVGMEKAQQWLALSDAGGGLEEFLRSNFNRANLVVILDFWHPAGYLERLAAALRPDDPDDPEGRQALARRWCPKLKHPGGQAMPEELRALKAPRGQAAREAYQEALSYFGSHAQRMDYPSYLSQGWQIGSGPVESACKTVVGQRLKQAGMRWREYGTDNVCHLRALFKSEKGLWHAFWENLN